MKRLFNPSLALILLLFLWAPAMLYCQEAPFLSGHWEGTIDIPGMKMEVDIDFSQQADGSWKGDISIPVQKAKDLPLANISVEGNQVTFSISGVPGDPTFKGTFSEDGNTICGDFAQSGQTFPFTLTREADPAAKAMKALEGFDDIVNDAIKTFKVPGLAIAIVKDDEVIFSRAFGHRDEEQKLPMTADTLLAIGSASKAFTTFALGVLVDEGKLEWDKPVRNYIPWFRLYDPVMGERLTPRDLVTHRSGLPRHDLVWYNNFTASREEFVRRLAYLEPSADLREKFQYNNLMYLTAGYLVEVLTGKEWEDSIRALVFEPLGMTRTNFSVEDSQKDNDFAQPYREEEGKIKKIPFRNITNIGPAGSINSSVNEMSNWLIVHLYGGKFKNKQIINPTTLEDMHLAHMPTGATPSRPEISPADYGMGWFVDNYRGHRRVHHGGNIDGFTAMVSMLPQDGFGFAVLSNKNGTPVPELIIRTAADILLELKPVDWLGEAAKRKAEGEEAEKKAKGKKHVRQKPGTKPAHKLEEYVGDYEHPGYGEIKVFLKDNKLTFTYNGITTPLEHWHYETFNGGEADDPTFKDSKLTFRTDAKGNVAEITAPFEPSTDEIIFNKKPDARFFDPEYLKQFTGQYKFLSQTFTVNLKGESLTLHVPGQPLYDLVPDLGGEFFFKQFKIISLRFIMDEQGNVTKFEMYQPSGVFEAERITEEKE
jgi:CubicO group peptidase (beta-lactamase class C family)